MNKLVSLELDTAAAENDSTERPAEAEVGSGNEVTTSPVDAPVNPQQTALQRRLHALQMKMNQSRQLNRKEVLHEGEKQQNNSEEKKGSDGSTVKKMNEDPMMEQAHESMRRASHKQRRSEQNQFAVNDYYNPEGQFRNYERNIKSLPKGSNVIDETTYDPLLLTNNNNNREGAHRLAEEMHRRIQKSKETKRKPKDIVEGDVNFINDRNNQFNKKIARNFDKYTAEIRHNLERGTA
jgi:pre-mRNA-splicing factor SYF2